MGGFGSGNRQQSGKLTVRACRYLDVDKLKKQGLFESSSKVTCMWADAFTVRAQYSDEWITMTHSDGKTKHSYRVEAYRRAQHLGGYRWVFCCPNQNCLKPCKRLYLRRGYFLCRQCQRLGYLTQQAAKADQPRLKLEKVRARLQWEPGFLNGHGKKPKGMHLETYLKLVQEHDELADTLTLQMKALVEGLTKRTPPPL